MSVNLDQGLQIYIAEAHDLLKNMEDSLLLLENDPGDAEAIASVFRAAHTIKGSAGIFNLDAIVKFTHNVEDVLDRVRDSEVAIDPLLIAVLLECSDHMLELIDVVAAKGEQLNEAAMARESDLLKRLATYQANGPSELEIGETVSDNWHISLRFGADVLKDGMDPLSFIRYLSKLGEVVSVVPLFDSIPEASEMDAESCYLGFEIEFKSDQEKEAIVNVFEFVKESSQIHVLAPHSKLADYIALIKALPEDEMRVGEILVRTGALTEEELNRALIDQKTIMKEDGSPEPLGTFLVSQGSVKPELVQAALDKQKLVRENKNNENKHIRVDADKLDDLISLVGELVIAGAGANSLAHRINNSALQESTSEISRLVEEIRGSALNLRMVQIGETFNRFQRVVRDVSKELGKDIDLIINGGETELDKTVVEKIGDPLMHLVRNALDHGIESTESRKLAGKSAKGTLHLNAYHDSGSIVIEIADDGAGLNRDKILQKAKDRGLLAESATPSDQEIYNLIFEPGFSTADAVTNLSGRGVGMDVVRRNVHSLRGTINLDSEAGLGTTVTIRLPLTLAIIDGFLVGVGKSSYVVPLDMVQECVELTEVDRQNRKDHGYLNLRGEVLPFVLLRDHFELGGNSGRRENVVVVRYAGKKAGLVVDELLGEFQTVIKPLGKLFTMLKGISGSTILGNGEVALIVDVPSLVNHASTQEMQKVSAKQMKHEV